MVEHYHTITLSFHLNLLQHVPVMRAHIPHLHFLILRQAHIPNLLLLLILQRTRYKVQHTARGAQTNKPQADAISPVVEVQLITLRERVRRDNPADIPKPDLPRSAHGAPVVAPQVHREPAHDDRHRGVRPAGDQEQCAVLDVVVVVGCDQDGEAGDADADRDQSKQEAMAQLVREESHEHGEAERCGPRGNAVQLCLNGGVAVGLDNTRGEVGIRIRGYNEPQVHQAAEEEFVVLETVDHVLEGDGSLEGGAALVVAEAGLDEGFLFGGEPFGLLREVGDEEEATE
jgi:hypothetical protein